MATSWNGVDPIGQSPGSRAKVTSGAMDISDLQIGEAQFTTDRGCGATNTSVPYDSPARAKFTPFTALAQPGRKASSTRHSL